MASLYRMTSILPIYFILFLIFSFANTSHEAFFLAKWSYMTKSDLIEKITQKTNLTKKKVESVVNCVFESMTGTLVSGDRIEIRGFGSWHVKAYKTYQGRNPKTGAAVTVPQKKLPFFKVGKELKKRIDDSKGMPIQN